MNKDKISEYDTDADKNTEVGSVGIRGSDPVHNMDNGLRKIMSHLADMNAGVSPISDAFTIGTTADLSKQARFDVSEVESGQKRVLRVPDADGTILTDTTLMDGDGKFLGDITGNAVTADNASAHIALTDNPHSVTKAQISLGDVDNTSDTDKPISTAAQSELNQKQNSSNFVIITGNITPGDDIPIPTGFTQAQCAFFWTSEGTDNSGYNQNFGRSGVSRKTHIHSSASYALGCSYIVFARK